ncbi:hypothetical protein HPGCJGGD_2573 [Methylobacterium haplocladii]|nr:hypothetical protein HPGCJGGD_2573 [Methylobacterium haplocladii]
MPAARAEVVGGLACPEPVVVVAPSEPDGPLVAAVIAASTSASITPAVFAVTATEPSLPVVVTAASVMEASAADWMVLVAITALMASALERDWFAVFPWPDWVAGAALSKAEVLPGTSLAVPAVSAVPSAFSPVCSRIVAIASTVASALDVIVALLSAATATLPAFTRVAEPLMAATTPPLISLRTTMPPADMPAEPVVLAAAASPSPTLRQRSRFVKSAVFRSSLVVAVLSGPI